MKLIADSGSTKTEWRFAGGDEKFPAVITSGINPYFHDAPEIARVVREELLPVAGEKQIRDIYFYGAGCSSEAMRSIVKKGLADCFPHAGITISHDLLAAARALCGRERGIAAILGTGSNSCLFDGEKIIDNVPSLGFILGDEGSGAYLGKKLLCHFLYRELPPPIHRDFTAASGLTNEKVLEMIYRKKNPNKYLASFSPFIREHISDPFMEKMVADSFTEFFRRHIFKYDNYGAESLHVVGSVGFHYREILLKAASASGIRAGKIMKSPMEGLVEFHSEGI